MTKPNTTWLSNQTPKKSIWPVWFPYPSSWLKAILSESGHPDSDNFNIIKYENTKHQNNNKNPENP